MVALLYLFIFILFYNKYIIQCNGAGHQSWRAAPAPVTPSASGSMIRHVRVAYLVVRDLWWPQHNKREPKRTTTSNTKSLNLSASLTETEVPQTVAVFF